MPEPNYVNTQLILGGMFFEQRWPREEQGNQLWGGLLNAWSISGLKVTGSCVMLPIIDSKSQKADLLMATTTDKSCREWACPTKTSLNVIWGIGHESAGTQQLCLCGSKPERRFKLTYPFSGEACYPQRYAGAPGLSRLSSQGSVWFPGTCTHTVGRDRKTVSVIKSSKKLWFLLLCSVGCMSKQSW